MSDIDKRDRGVALYYKGIALVRTGDQEAAKAAFRESWKVARFERAKRRLESMEKKKDQ